MARTDTTTAPRPSAKGKTRSQIIVEAGGDPALAAPALAELAQRSGGDPVAIHAGARQKFEATDYVDGNVPTTAVEEYGAADEALIRTHVSSLTGIAYKLSLALELTAPGNPKHPMGGADFSTVITNTDQTDQRLIASAALDCLTLARGSAGRGLSAEWIAFRDDYTKKTATYLAGAVPHKAQKKEYLALLAYPSRTIEEVLEKIAATDLDHWDDDKDIDHLEAVRADLQRIVAGRVIAAVEQPRASKDFQRLRDQVLELASDRTDKSNAQVDAETALQDRFFKTAAPDADAVADKLTFALTLDDCANGQTMDEAVLYYADGGGTLLEQVVAIAIRDLKRMQSTTAWEPTFWAWEAALAEHQLAQSAQEAANAEFDLNYEAVKSETPLPAELIIDGREITTEYLLGELRPRDGLNKTALLPIVRQWRKDRDAAAERHQLDALEKAVDAAHRARWDAFEKLAQTPPPNMAAMAYVLRELINLAHADFIDDHADNPDTISRNLSVEYWDGGRAPAILYLSAMRAAGLDTPAFAAERFDPRAWIEDFERLSGHRMTRMGPVFREPEAFLGGGSPRGHARWQALRDWQKEAVKEIAPTFREVDEQEAEQNRIAAEAGGELRVRERSGAVILPPALTHAAE